ncbi:MAG TPA: hypothetical protein PKW55_00585 [Spirochaetota bacterium]|nr:hypothetical protein [Spirochaetota bacterium]HOM39269.1 hypothetical protein [Spirochaetota bacterium]HPQ49270.1 hypothetical protein [Spirochaetota bacterium]
MGLREKAKKYRINDIKSKGNILKEYNPENYEKKDIRERAIEIFLKSDIKIEEDEYNIYTLNDELEITNRNRSIQIILIVILFIFSILLSTKLISNYIDAKSRDLIVNIAEFSDLNIQEIIEAAKKSKEELEKVKNELSYLKDNMDKEVEKIKKEFEERQKSIAGSKGISEEERKKLLQKMKEEQEKAIREAAIKYNNQIEEKEKYLKKVEDKIKENESKLEMERKKAEIKLEEAKLEAAKKLDATRSLYELKIKEIKDDYEKKRENYEKEIRNFKAEIEETKKQIGLYLSKIKSYEDEITSIKNSYKSLMEEKKEIEKSLVILKNEVNIYKMYLTTFFEQMEILGVLENVSGYVFTVKDDYCYIILSKIVSIENKKMASVFDKGGKLVAKIEFINSKNQGYLRIFEAKIVKKYYDIYPTYTVIIEE